MSRRRTALVLASALAAIPATVAAQQASGTSGAPPPPPPPPPPAQPAATAPPADDDAETVETDDLLRPGRGRVRVRIEATRAPAIRIGVSSATPRREARAGVFTDERAPEFCATPCTLFLAPGLRRIVGDVGTAFPWQVDVPVDAAGNTRLRLQPHGIGWSALGGVMFVLGVSGGLMGPAGIVGSAVIANSRVTVPLVLGGVGAGLAGVGLAIGGWFVLQLGIPRAQVGRSAVAHALRGIVTPGIVVSDYALPGATLTLF